MSKPRTRTHRIAAALGMDTMTLFLLVIVGGALLFRAATNKWPWEAMAGLGRPLGAPVRPMRLMPPKTGLVPKPRPSWVTEKYPAIPSSYEESIQLIMP